MATHLTCTEGGSKKFWKGSIDGKSLVVQWGRIGTKGQSKTKPFKDSTAAKKELAKLIAEKLAKGYVAEAAPRAPSKSEKARQPSGMTTPAKPAKASQRSRVVKPAKPAQLVDALFRLIRNCRKQDDRALAKQCKKLAAIETRPAFRTLFELLAVHRSMGFGEIMGIGPGPVSDANDRDRTDVLGIACDGGGNIFAIAAPGTSNDERITRFIPRDNWRSDRQWSDLADFLKEMDDGEREQLEANHPDDPSEWRTSLMTALDG